MNIRKFTVINLALVALVILLQACGSTKNSTEEVNTENTLFGKVDVAGMSTYMYGTHKFYTDDTFYAIRSKAYDLNEFVGKEVTIIYKKIEGYPVESGPEYLEVLKIKE